eukprot:TRINITY_DN18048_c0_g1_i1.p1 TRINITY_DN18048_c0_g1~~TRINITY_DN18048_c0_g1_i1.p1  ORF type:complete len:536 (+),score=172.28 TRINITY_DN18048_c0_g1_i1:89-1609(+)
MADGDDECDRRGGISVLLPTPVLSSPARSPVLQRRISGYKIAKGTPVIKANLQHDFRCCDNEEEVKGASLKPWARAMLRHSEYGGGNVQVMSQTVILSENIVLKATKRIEATLLTELNKILGSRVPVLIACLPAEDVFDEVPSGCEVAILYHKTQGVVGKDLVENLMHEWIADKTDRKLDSLMQVVEAVVQASRDLYEAGVVHQDLWLGNIVVTDEIAFDNEKQVCFLDVVDCAEATPSSFTASLGGLLISIEGLLLGLLLNDDNTASFPPKELWESLPHPWWVHTHWTSTPVLNDKDKLRSVRSVMDRLLGMGGLEDVMKIGMITHMERFVGSIHPVVKEMRMAHLAGKQRFLPIKRAVLEHKMIEKSELEHCIRGVRGKGFWTILRQELGKGVVEEVKAAVLRRVAPPPQVVGGPCPDIRTPSYLPPAMYPHPYGVINMTPAPMLPLSAVSTSVSPASVDALANLLTLEQMTRCGEFPDHVITTLQNWSDIHGFRLEGCNNYCD